MHYCCGELVSTSINKEAKSCCDDNGDCCENKEIHFAIEDDCINRVQLKSITPLDFEILCPVLFALQFYFHDGSVPINQYNYSPPPTKLQILLALLQSYLC